MESTQSLNDRAVPHHIDDRAAPVRRSAPMSKAIWWAVLIGGLALVGEIVYRALAPLPDLRLPPPRTAGQPAPAAPAASVPAEPEVRYPLGMSSPEKPLPALDTSDATLRNALHELVPDPSLAALFQTNEFVRHVVATIDNIPRQKIAQRLMPVKPTAGTFIVAGNGDTLAIAPANSARYAPAMRLVARIEPEKAVGLYLHFYPLFQQAYKELGYPKSYFNDRVIEAIDHLLATPDVKGPIRLARPKVLYVYADPALESLSAGQKTLIRMGSENADAIKAKLREIRSELLRQGQKKN